MNFLTLVFSILLLLSFGTYVSLAKEAESRRLRTSYLGHIQAERSLLSKYEQAIYRSLPSIPKEKKEQKSKSSKKAETKQLLSFNPPCARLNLWPLVQEGKELHPYLYETALRLLQTIYGKTLPHPKEFLDLFLKKAKKGMEHPRFSLETLDLGDPVYYTLLRGTKNWSTERGYPSLLDLVQIEESSSKICVCHAHPRLLTALLGEKKGFSLYEELHKEHPGIPSLELYDRLGIRADFLSMGRPSHRKQSSTTLLAQDDAKMVSLRKTMALPSNVE